jgi:hypothetical protein
MHYIRKQILDFSHGVSAKVITYEEFYIVLDFIHNAAVGDLYTRNKKINNTAIQWFTHYHEMWCSSSFSSRTINKCTSASSHLMVDYCVIKRTVLLLKLSNSFPRSLIHSINLFLSVQHTVSFFLVLQDYFFLILCRSKHGTLLAIL